MRDKTKMPSRISDTAFFLAVTVISLCMVVINLNHLHTKLGSDSGVSGGASSLSRAKMMDRMLVSLRLRTGQTSTQRNDTSQILREIRERLEIEVKDKVNRDFKILAAKMELNLSKTSQDDASSARHITFRTVGLEDLDEAVEERAVELSAQAKLDPSFRPGYFIRPWSKTYPKWPFQLIHDRDKRDTGVIGLAAPFVDNYFHSEMEKALFWRLKAEGHIMLGISSYEWYPGNATNPYTDRVPQKNPEDKRIYASMDGFLHCFREPHLHIPPGIPRTMISQSDFINPNNRDNVPKNLEKTHAFVYSNLAGNWNDFNRNWTLAQACIKQAAAKGMKSVLVGKRKDLEAGKGNRAGMNKDKVKDLAHEIKTGMVELVDKLEHRDFLDIVERSEFFFIPNLSDASPRVAAEALCRNIPLLINRHIAGGWKYINEETGVFFDGLDDFIPAVERLRQLKAAGKLRPRAWFMENYGPYISSLRLHAFIELIAGTWKMEQAGKLVA